MSLAPENSGIWDKMFNRKKISARFFNTVMPYLHHCWTAQVLNMQINTQKGPDLIDDKKIVEIKFTLEKQGKYPLAWTVLEHQMKYTDTIPGYWALGIYSMNTAVNRLHSASHSILEECVENRELYLVTWNWMLQFPPHKTSGKTERSEWKNTFRYPKYRCLPDITGSFDVEKGRVYITKGVPAKAFTINSSSFPYLS